MPQSLLPKYLLTALILALGIICIVSLALYRNYTDLSSALVATGLGQSEAAIQARVLTDYSQDLADIERLIDRPIANDESALREKILSERLEKNTALQSLYFEPLVVDFDSGAIHPPTTPVWGKEKLTLRADVIYAREYFGQLVAVFSLGDSLAEQGQLSSELAAIEQQYRARGALWVAATTFVMLLGSALLAWLTASRLVRPISQLTEQARKVTDGDYGERLPETRGDEIGEMAAAFNSMRDQLRQTTISRDYIDSVLASMNDAVIVTGPDGAISRINAATEALLGFNERELLGLPVQHIVAEDKLRNFLDTELGPQPTESTFVAKSGERIPVSWTGSVIESDNPLFAGTIYTAHNIRDRKRAEQRIRYLARIDALTKVPNRMQFQHLLQRGLARARREGHQIALLYLDIDQFKDINDTFGHLAGDAALETLTQRLGRELPEEAVIGRLAGDEFAVILDDIPVTDGAAAAVARQAKQVLNQIELPFEVQGHEVFMTASIGIAFYPEDAGNVIDLIRNADAALYSAKKGGGNRYDLYTPSMNEAAVERLMLKSKLRRSFERDELLLHYQPKYSLSDGKVIGAEALVRWELPERGLIMPAEFIPLAEETNLIVEIGEWVLDRVCADYREWQKTIPDPGRIAINLSLKQLKQRNFAKKMARTLKRHGISPTSLEFEITETTLMEDPVKTIKILDELYAMGLHLAIDDFGTGYSSLSALQQFPLNTLKIDRSFVRDAAIDTDDATIVETIIDMGRSLKMDVVAEGVETEEQLAFLQTLHCNYVQGLLFGEPMNTIDYHNLLAAQLDGTDHYRALFA